MNTTSAQPLLPRRSVCIAVAAMLAGCGGGSDDADTQNGHPTGPPGWARIAEQAPWGMRDAGATAVFNDAIWLLGGWRYEDGVTTLFTDAWRSEDGLNWKMTSPPWTFGMYGMATATNDSLLYMGGLKNSRLPDEELSNEVWSTSDGVAWTFRGKADWEPRIGACLVRHAGSVWILGGKVENSGNPDVFRNDVWNSVDGVHWRRVAASTPWAPRAFHAAVSHQGRLWVIGGGDWDSKIGRSDVWSSVDGQHWQQHPDAPWEGRIWHACQSYAGKIYVIGGRLFDPIRTVDEIWTTADGNLWKRGTDTTVPGPRHAPYAALFDDQIWIMGGSANGYLYADVWRYAAP